LFSRKLRSAFSILALLPFAIPPALIAFGLIQFSGKIPGSNPIVGSLILIVGLSARYFPIVVYILYAHALTINPHLTDAAQLHSGSWFRNFLQIWLPLNWNVIKKAFFFFILLSIAEIGLAVLLVPPDCMTASVNIYSMLHYGFEKEVAIETLLLVTVAVVLGYFILREKPKNYTGNVS
jgi:ABC-type Fe3+ transport system permease subunit